MTQRVPFCVPLKKKASPLISCFLRSFKTLYFSVSMTRQKTSLDHSYLWMGKEPSHPIILSTSKSYLFLWTLRNTASVSVTITSPWNLQKIYTKVEDRNLPIRHRKTPPLVDTPGAICLMLTSSPRPSSILPRSGWPFLKSMNGWSKMFHISVTRVIPTLLLVGK